MDILFSKKYAISLKDCIWAVRSKYGLIKWIRFCIRDTD